MKQSLVCQIGVRSILSALRCRIIISTNLFEIRIKFKSFINDAVCQSDFENVMHVKLG